MGIQVVDGTYENGRITLERTPEGVETSRVRVTFLHDPAGSRDAGQREALRQRLLRRLRTGVDFGSEPMPTREELYADRIARFR
jgi:hypothetical protein